MTSSKLCEKPKSSITKFPLALLIVVISFASSNVSAYQPFEDQLSDLCRDGSMFSAYERKHRKCFVALTLKGAMNWHNADRTCKQLPRIEHFEPPTLATIDLNADEMTTFINSKLKYQRTWLWIGAHIPFNHVHGNKKCNDEWRWVANDRRLSLSHSAWRNGDPSTTPDKVCGAFDAIRGSSGIGIVDRACTMTHYVLCQYKATNAEVCPYPPVPSNAKLLIDKKIETQAGTVVTVRCHDGYVVKGTGYEKEQMIFCKRGKWIMIAHDCVKQT